MNAVPDSVPCLVSIITPCYNTEPFIAATIESVLAQSMTNWEMIVVDDGSTDASNAIVASYAAWDSRITLVTLNQHAGVHHARKTAVGRARGRYIAFLDSDDLWLPDKLAKQTAFMADHDLAFSYTSYQLIDREDNNLGTFVTAPSITYVSLLKTCSVGCLTAMYDTRKLGKVYLSDVARDDYALWLTILKQIKTAKGIVEPLAVYRVSKPSYSSNKFRAARRQWRVYRQYEQLGRAQSMYYFCHYVYHGLAKYFFSRRHPAPLSLPLLGRKSGGGGQWRESTEHDVGPQLPTVALAHQVSCGGADGAAPSGIAQEVDDGCGCVLCAGGDHVMGSWLAGDAAHGHWGSDHRFAGRHGLQNLVLDSCREGKRCHNDGCTGQVVAGVVDEPGDAHTGHPVQIAHGGRRRMADDEEVRLRRGAPNVRPAFLAEADHRSEVGRIFHVADEDDAVLRFLKGHVQQSLVDAVGTHRDVVYRDPCSQTQQIVAVVDRTDEHAVKGVDGPEFGALQFFLFPRIDPFPRQRRVMPALAVEQ